MSSISMANRTFLSNDISKILKAPSIPTVVETSANNCISVTETFHSRQESWVIPLVVICALNVAAILVFEAYVLYKSCGSKRHLFLGQILLFGLLLSSLTGFAFVPTPNWFTCALTRTGVGIASVVIFATLLVKCVFLLSLHVGVVLSAAYQGLLLFFAIAVQLVIAVQWLIYRPVSLIIVDEVTCSVRCGAPASDTVASLAYNMLLMLGVGILAIQARTVRENYHESRFIGLAITLCIPLWVAWIVASSVSSTDHHDPCLAFGIVLTATVIFLVMFLPKAHQISVLDRNGIYADDGFSSVNHSIYTPSFFHLKPPMLPFVKQGTLMKPLTSSFPAHPEFFYWKGNYSSRVRQEVKPRGEKLQDLALILASDSAYETIVSQSKRKLGSKVDRYFAPPVQHASRLWRYNHHPATLQLQSPLHPSPEDIYLPNERFLFGPPGMKLYRSPLY